MTEKEMRRVFNENLSRLIGFYILPEKKKRIKDRKYTQKILQDKLILSDTGVQDLLGGDTLPRANVLYNLAELFKCSVDQLLGREELTLEKKSTTTYHQSKRKEDTG